MTQHALDAWNAGRIHRQAIKTKADQHQGVQRFTGHLTTNTHADAGTMGSVTDHFQCAQNRRVKGVIEISDMLITAIYCKKVLDQVIGANGEEIDFLRQKRGNHYRRWGFDHDADRDVRITSNPLMFQLRCYLAQNPFTGTDFGNAADHRKHDFYRTMAGGPQNCPQLYPEQGYLLQRKTDSSQPHGGVCLVIQI